MEQRKKVRLTTSDKFDLERDEIKRLYIYLSLSQYSYLRVPNYRERLLLAQLTKDLKKFSVEMQQQTEREPNNLTLNRIRVFFDVHYRKLKQLTDEYRQRDIEAVQEN